MPSVIEFIDHEHYANGYQMLPPHSDLKEVVDFIHFSQLRELYAQPIQEICFPSFGINILFPPSTKSSQQAIMRRRVIPIQQCLILPRHESSLTLHHSFDEMLGVRCPVNFLAPEASSLLFTGSTPLLVSQLPKGNAVFHLKSEASLAERLKEIEEFLYRFMSVKTLRESHYVTEAISHMRTNLEAIRIENIAREFSITNKSLGRYFLKYTGLSPKGVFRILRFRKSLATYLSGSDNFDFSGFGFYDLSHFYREIKGFTGMYPHQILKLSGTRSISQTRQLTTV